jgi:hypothetical protein
MSTALGLLIVLIVILAGVYALTRDLPPPDPPAPPCARDADCPPPRVCRAGVCADPALRGLLWAAWASAVSLRSAVLNAAALFADPGQILADGEGLRDAAAAMGLPAPDLGALRRACAAAAQDFANYVDEFLVVPGCIPSAETSCGYYSQVTSLTMRSSPIEFVNIGPLTGGLTVMLPMALQGNTAVVVEIGNLISLVISEGQENNKPLDAVTRSAIGALNAIAEVVTGLSDPVHGLPAYAAAAARDGHALYAHFVGGVARRR